MKRTLDLRIQKTHKALIGAFLELLKEHKFEKITVNEICDLAMVRRATFYKHFGDKYEFFSFMVQEIQNDYRTQSDSYSCEKPITPYVMIIKNTLNFLDENELLVKSVSESSAYSILLNIVSEQIVKDVREKFREDAKNGKELLLSPDLMAQAYTGALINIAQWWFKHKNHTSKEEIVDQIKILIERLYGVEEN